MISYNFGDGQMLYALMARTNGSGIRVWVERLDGIQYGDDWSVYVPGLALALVRDEFCAHTWGDYAGLMASAMLSTGWFMKTGKEFRFPESHVHNDGSGEIWKLTHLGMVWLSCIESEVVSQARSQSIG